MATVMVSTTAMRKRPRKLDGAVPSGKRWRIRVGERAKSIRNPIREIMDSENPAKKLVSLAQGDPTSYPHLRPSPDMVGALQAAVASGSFNGYQPSQGSLVCREAVARYFSPPGRSALQAKAGFRQQLVFFHDGVVANVSDEHMLRQGEAQLVLVPFSPASEKQVKELRDAAGSGLASTVEAILQRPQDPDLGQPTPLLVACAHGHLEVVELLLEARADPHRATNDGITPLFIAAQEGQLEVARLLLEVHADKDMVMEDGTSPLLIASQSGKVEVVRLLLEAKADKDKAKEDGATSLFMAAQKGQLEVARLLMEAAADTDKAKDDGATPLFIAAQEGQLDVARLLLEAKADKNKARHHGATPLFVAAQEGQLEVVRLLTEAQADKDSAIDGGATPLFVAAQEGRLEVAQLLLEAKADKDKATNMGATPLFMAAAHGRLEVGRLLMEAKADKDKATNIGATPLFIAAQEGQLEVVRLLLEAKADKDRAKNDGTTALFVAARCGQMEVALRVAPPRDVSYVEPHLEDVFMTLGCSEALSHCIAALAAPGNMLLPRPGFPLYSVLCEYHGVEVRYYDLLPDCGWQCDIGGIAKLVDENTCALLLNNPSNPCGAVFTREHLVAVLSTAEELGLPVIADEVYADMSFARPFVACAAATASIPILSVCALSKRWLAPGWRAGWITVHDADGALAAAGVPETLLKLCQVSLGPSAPIQGAIPEIFASARNGCDWHSGVLKALEESAQCCMRRCRSIPGLEVASEAQGAMYLMVRLKPNALDLGTDDVLLASKLLEEEILGPSPSCLANVLRLLGTSAWSSQRLRRCWRRPGTGSRCSAAATAVRQLDTSLQQARIQCTESNESRLGLHRTAHSRRPKTVPGHCPLLQCSAMARSRGRHLVCWSVVGLAAVAATAFVTPLKHAPSTSAGQGLLGHRAAWRAEAPKQAEDSGRSLAAPLCLLVLAYAARSATRQPTSKGCTKPAVVLLSAPTDLSPAPESSVHI
eukprot:s1657_g6.t4